MLQNELIKKQVLGAPSLRSSSVAGSRGAASQFKNKEKTDEKNAGRVEEKPFKMPALLFPKMRRDLRRARGKEQIRRPKRHGEGNSRVLLLVICPYKLLTRPIRLTLTIEFVKMFQHPLKQFPKLLNCIGNPLIGMIGINLRRRIDMDGIPKPFQFDQKFIKLSIGHLFSSTQKSLSKPGVAPFGLTAGWVSRDIGRNFPMRKDTKSVDQVDTIDSLPRILSQLRPNAKSAGSQGVIYHGRTDTSLVDTSYFRAHLRPAFSMPSNREEHPLLKPSLKRDGAGTAVTSLPAPIPKLEIE